MSTETTMLHVRVDSALKAQAAERLAQSGMTLSDAVRVLLARVVHEGGLPVGLAAGSQAYDEWFRAKVWEALNEADSVPHDTVMDDAQKLIDACRECGRRQG